MIVGPQHKEMLGTAIELAYPRAIDLETADADAIREATVQAVLDNERKRIDWLLWKLRYVMHWPVLATHGEALQPYFDVFCDVGRTHVLGRECDELRDALKDEVRYVSVLTGNHQVPRKMSRDGGLIRFVWREKPEVKWAEGVFQTAPPTLHQYVTWAEAGVLLQRMNNFRGI